MEPEPRTLTVKSDKMGTVEFVSRLSHDEAARILEAADEGTFERNLAEKFRRWGWSADQMAWGHYLALRRTGAIKAPPRPVTLGGLVAIVQMFDAAAEKLRAPSITFEISPGGVVELARAGQRSKTPGAVNVTDGKRYPNNRWFGRIDRDGSTTISDRSVLEFLADFATDPAAKAAEYGAKSGRCCFCNLRLKDARSIEVGYGPQCAKNYGVAWGRKPATLQTPGVYPGSGTADGIATGGTLVEAKAAAPMQRNLFPFATRNAGR